MFFRSIEEDDTLPKELKNQVLLRKDNWNDWFVFKTAFIVYYFDKDGMRQRLGWLKVAHLGMNDKGTTILENEFDELPQDFFSLGDEGYYDSLRKFDPRLRDKILTGLRDVAKGEAILEMALQEKVMHQSLLRDISLFTVRNQFRRMTNGGARLTPFDFDYNVSSKENSENENVILNFQVYPESTPPTNIHVLIGKNGVGKTWLFSKMTKSVLGLPEGQDDDFGKFVLNDETETFANLVLVNFSAFDTSSPINDKSTIDLDIKYSYVGLRLPSLGDASTIGTKTPSILAEEFATSLKNCTTSIERRYRWEKAISTLETDENFKTGGFKDILRTEDVTLQREEAIAKFNQLSSGHKIVLLTIVNLVEVVEEKTLVLIDEPEAHLHPPLLSSLVRTISDLLIDRNGVAIIATHSPVVLQEVPRSCVWKLRKVGDELIAERPEIETFGENVGVLTREVFGLEVTYSGFHKMLQDVASEELTSRAVIAAFHGQLGIEARAILAVLMAKKDSDNDFTI